MKTKRTRTKTKRTKRRTAPTNRRSCASPTKSKYPPAEPGALRIGPLEAATLNPKLCLLGRRTKYTLPTSPRPFIQFFATPENRCLLRIASRLDAVKVSRLSIVKLHFVCVVAHDLRFRRWATVPSGMRLEFGVAHSLGNMKVSFQAARSIG